MEQTQYVVGIHTDSTKPTNESHRLSVIAFKTPSDKKNDATYKRPVTRSVSVPQITLTIQPDVIRDALQAAYYDLQDQVIREIVVSSLDAGMQAADGTLKKIVIDSNQISLEACAAFYARKSIGTKLSKDMLASWFDSDLATQLELALISALKLPEQPAPEEQAKLDAAVKQHRNLIVSLAAPTASLPDHITKQLQRAVNLADDSPVKTTLSDKLHRFLKPVEEITLLGLGEEL